MFSSRLFVLGVLITVLAIYQLASVDGEDIGSTHVDNVSDLLGQMPPVLNKVLEILNIPPKWILEIIGCVAQDLSYLRCDFNFSTDIFYILDQCVEDPALRETLKNIESAIPAVTFAAAVPPHVSDDLCYNPYDSNGIFDFKKVFTNYLDLAQANIFGNAFDPSGILPLLEPLGLSPLLDSLKPQI